MIYIGHFSFDEVGAEKEIRHGYFSCVVKTDSAETAANEFKELILSLFTAGHRILRPMKPIETQINIRQANRLLNFDFYLFDSLELEARPVLYPN